MNTASLPHPRWRIPVLGDLLSINVTEPVQTSVRLARELGPIFSRRFLGRDIVIVSGADLVADLSDESRFAKHVGLGVEALRGIGGDGLFTAYNDEPNWRKAHDILRPAFTQRAMRTYHPAMLDVAGQLVKHWDSHVDGPPVDVTPDMTKLTLETIARTGFGYGFDSFGRDQPHPFVAAMVGALRHAQREQLRLPLFGRVLTYRSNRRNAADSAYLARVVDEVIAARRAAGDTDTSDLLGLMLHTRHPDTGEALDPENIRYQVLTFLIAGHETTSGALSFALYHLSRHPAALARAQAEVDAVWGAGEPAFEQVARLRYVRRVLDEALRLWPTAPGYAREARVDTLLGGRYPMRRGQWVIVLLPALHRDPVWGPDPEAFDPDRFSPEQVKGRPAHVHKPFGTGERACIGRQFALHEATLVLGLLLRRYHLRGEPDYRLRIQELLTLKPEGFRLHLTGRPLNGPGTPPPATRTAGSR
jgi:cytochrome P450